MAAFAPPAGLDDGANARMQTYFTSLAPHYVHLTGNSTQLLLKEALNSTPLGIRENSSIHDAAAGPGTATEAVLDWCESRSVRPPPITATDSNQAMIEKLEATITEKGWNTVTASVMDSHKLTYKDNTFNFVLCNFSVFTYSRPLKALAELHRTLKHGGIAVVTCWKTWGVDALIREARSILRGREDDEPLATPGGEFVQQGYLAWAIEEAGWERGKIKTLEQRIVLGDAEGLQGLQDFLTGPSTMFSRKDWTEDERLRWPAAVKEAIANAQSRSGGIVMEAWVVLARKWDALYA